MDPSATTQRQNSGTVGGSNEVFQTNDGGTFIVDMAASTSGDGEMRQRPPVSASDFNHMFSPLTIEQMFRRSPSGGDGSNTRSSVSITGMLWQNNGSVGVGSSVESAGDTLKQLLSNGSNPVENAQHGQQQQQQQQPPQQPQQYRGQYMSQQMSMADNGALITPFSPPETVVSPAGTHEEARAQSLTAVATAATTDDIPRPGSARSSVAGALPPQPPLRQISQRRSALLEPRRIPLIQNMQNPRPASRASIASFSTTDASVHQSQPASSYGSNYAGVAPVPLAQNLRMLPQQPAERVPPATANPQRRTAHRPAPMQEAGQADYYSHQPQIHSAIGPGNRQPADLSLRHEVLDRVARRSQPSTPQDAHVPLPSSQRPGSVVQHPGSYAEHGYAYGPHTGNDITMLPGDNRAQSYMWSTGESPEQQQQQQLGYQDTRQQRNTAAQSAAHRPASLSQFGSLRKADYPGVGQVRKSSDGSAKLLTPKDFNGLLSDRIGDMVLNKEIGEWVHIKDYTQPSQNVSPDMQGSQGQLQDVQARLVSREPSSKRSSVSIHSHTSAFPLPLPTKDKSGLNSYGIGLISPVENQRKHVREMSERQSLRRGGSLRGRPIEDDALGSIVQRLMTPATSPETCTALDLSGSGIRNLSGLSQLTSRLEAICLSGNKLQGLSGLPMGLVSLKAPSNWIRFSPTDGEKFIFARELPHLEEIDLSANEISDVSVFSGLRHLRILELNRNRVESLRDLRGCRRLLHLRLRDNILTTFDLEASETPLLATLDVFNNRLRVVPANVAGFTQLARINMAKNDLEKIELHGPAAESIRELRLSENPLIMRRSGRTIDVDLWTIKFPNLKTLYLDICNIRQLCRSGNVYAGDTSNPQSLTSVDDNTGWGSLFNLSLRGNALRPPLDIDFACLRNMKNLYTPDTLLTLPRTLPQMNHLLQLVMCNSGLTQLPLNMGAALPQLKLLDVSNNPELVDPTPIIQLSSSLEVLKCRAVGFGSASHLTSDSADIAGRWSTGEVETFPDAENGNGLRQEVDASIDEQRILRWLSKLRRLRRLDFRFNRCTADLYAPPPSSAYVVGAASVLDGALSPQAPGQSVMGDGGHPGAHAATVPGNMARIDEETWLRQDHAYVTGLKMARQTALIRRREGYWISAIRLFPRLEELDGIKIGPH
ncbi:Protein nud1 [Coemansia guatemalensis]|uniref:Protein nud1 n=1 Tax=Coemansia guatemalensis TaxID=2761395 RepID=A0A9W8LRI7_9FUNG|nr:Protein nud1 [Coemansia guatemalensis]